jgi:hypothetical protein
MRLIISPFQGGTSRTTIVNDPTQVPSRSEIHDSPGKPLSELDSFRRQRIVQRDLDSNDGPV